MVTRHQTEYVWKKISSLGWRLREPEETDFAYEEPSVFPELLRVHGDMLGYDVDTIAKLVAIDPTDLHRIYRPYLGKGKAGLYVVR